MTTDMIPFDSTPGTGLAAMPAHILANMGEGNLTGRTSIDQLSINGKTWRIIVDGEEKPLMKADADSGEMVPVSVINVVVLDFNRKRSRAFYAGKYVPGQNKAPDCYSGDGVTPDPGVAEPCAATCAACPNAAKGSKVSEEGVAGVACASFKRLAVIPIGPMMASHPPLLLKLPQTSIWDKSDTEERAKQWFAWDQFAQMLAEKGAKHTAALEVRMKFDSRTAHPKVLFNAQRWLTDAEYAIANARAVELEEQIKQILSGANAHDGVAGRPALTNDADTGDKTPVVTKTTAPDPAIAAAAAAKKAVEAAEKAAAAEAKKKADAKAAAKAALLAQMAALEAEEGDDAGATDTGVEDAVIKSETPTPAPVVTRANSKGKATKTVDAAPAAVEAVAPTATVVASDDMPADVKDLLKWDA